MSRPGRGPDPTGPDAALVAAVAGAGLDPGGRGRPGTDLEYRYEPDRTVTLLADALRALHAVPVPAGVPPLEPTAVVDSVRAGVARGTGRGDLDAAYAHLGPERLVEILDQGVGRVVAGRRVVTHGAATLDALRCEAGGVLGLQGRGGLAVADPYRDLAVAARSVAATFGPLLVPDLCERYLRGPADPVRLDWWALASVLVEAAGP